MTRSSKKSRIVFLAFFLLISSSLLFSQQSSLQTSFLAPAAIRFTNNVISTSGIVASVSRAEHLPYLKEVAEEPDFQPYSPRACNRTEQRVSDRCALCLSAPRRPFWWSPLQSFQTRRSFVSETGPFARNGLFLARNGFRFHGLHSGVNGPGLLLRCLVHRVKCPFGHSAPPPELVCPNSRSFHASDPLHFPPANSSGCSLRLHSPPGILAPSGSKRSTGVAAVRSAFRFRPISACSP